MLHEDSANDVDLEDPASLARLDEPNTPLPRSTAWSSSTKSSAGRQKSESLAGRMERIAIGGSTRTGLGRESVQELRRRSGFPLAHLARTERGSLDWRRQFIQTLLERDLPQWGVRVPAVALLSDALMIPHLQPWHGNLGKRQVKSLKVYVRDSGLLHQLLGLGTEKELLSHPKLGASWEGAEIDLLLRRGSRLLGVECKRADAPRLTPSIRIALDDLGLSRVAIVYPGAKRFAVADHVEAVPIETLTAPGGLFPG